MSYTKVYAKHDIVANLRNEDGSRMYKYIIHEGSSRSSKTISLIQHNDDTCSDNPNTRVTVWRDTRTSLGSTVWSDFRKFLGWKHKFGKQTSPIHYPNGSTFEPHGADFTNAHGLTQDIAWLNEPYKITKETFDAIDQRADLIIIDWNPKQGHWIDDLKKHDRAIVIHSTFLDNQHCPEEQKLKILSYEPWETGSYSVKNRVPYYNGKPITLDNQPPLNEYNSSNKTINLYNWLVYGLGIKAEKPNKIYHGWNKISLKRYNEETKDLPGCNGLDFGMVSPSGCAELRYNASKHRLYIRELWYQPVPTDKTYADLFKKFKVNGKEYTIADSAEPQEIAKIYTAGFRCIGAYKGKGSVHSGIKNLQTVEVYYVGDNIELEYDGYEWEVDRYGLPMDVPIKKDDHILDGIRYGWNWLKGHLNIK